MNLWHPPSGLFALLAILPIWSQRIVGAFAVLAKLVETNHRINQLFEARKAALVSETGDQSWFWGEYRFQRLKFLSKLVVLVKIIGISTVVRDLFHNDFRSEFETWSGRERRIGSPWLLNPLSWSNSLHVRRRFDGPGFAKAVILAPPNLPTNSASCLTSSAILSGHD